MHIWNMWAIKEMWECSCWKEVCARSCMEIIIPTQGHLQYSPCSLEWSSPSGGKQADPKTRYPLVMVKEGTFRMAASAQLPEKTRGDMDSNDCVMTVIKVTVVSRENGCGFSYQHLLPGFWRKFILCDHPVSPSAPPFSVSGTQWPISTNHEQDV